MLQLFLQKSKAIFATWTKNRNEQNKNRNNQEEYIPPRVPLSFLHLTTFPVCIHSDVEPSELVFSLEQLEHSLQPHGLCPQTAVSPLQADKAGQDPSLQHSQSALLSSKGIVKSKQIYYHLKCQQRLKKNVTLWFTICFRHYRPHLGLWQPWWFQQTYLWENTTSLCE